MKASAFSTLGRRPMQLLCPACHVPLAAAAAGQTAVSCTGCALEVDLSRLGTVAGKPRFLPERDRTGTAVGGWQVQRFLGAGGMGQVYRAERDGQLAAIKFLSTGLAGDPELRARFSREVKLLEGLAHPAIVQVTDSGEAEGVPWFAMTLVEGPSLRGRLTRSGPLTLEEVREVFGRVLAALAHAHGRGVVHRDLKPPNVLLAPAGAVVADFGIARAGEAAPVGRTQLTDTAAVMGTLAYMSPEQRAGAPVDRRSDLFAVGVMLYEALTGTVPQGAFSPPSALRPALPARLDAVVLRLLRPRAEDRFASAEDADRALSAALAPVRWPRRAALAAGGVTGLMALAGGGWWAFRGPVPADKSLGKGDFQSAPPPLTLPPVPQQAPKRASAPPGLPAAPAVDPTPTAAQSTRDFEGKSAKPPLTKARKTKAPEKGTARGNVKGSLKSNPKSGPPPDFKQDSRKFNKP